MYCRYCGAELDDDAVFCENCGKRVKEASDGSDTDTQRERSSAQKKGLTGGRRGRKMLLLLAMMVVAAVAVVMAVPAIRRVVDPYSVAFDEVGQRVKLDDSDESDTPLPSLTQYERELSSLGSCSLSLKDKGKGNKRVQKGSDDIGAIRFDNNTMTIVVKQKDKCSSKYFKQLIAAAIMACNSDATENRANRDAKDIVEYGFNGSYLDGMQYYHVLSVNDDDGVGEDYYACVITS